MNSPAPADGASPAAGTLYGVGVGPGDPELLTLKAARLIESAPVVAYHCARHGRSIARSVAAAHLRPDQIEEQLVYPVTTEATDHPGGYGGAIAEFYDDAAGRLRAHLRAGRDVVLLAEGDPMFYSSYMHMHRRLAGEFAAVVVPGVTSISAAAAAAQLPLTEGSDRLSILPATLPPDVLAEQLRGEDAAAIMKVSRDFAGVREALERAGRLGDARFVERASTPQQRVADVADVDPAQAPYMSVVIVPGAQARQPQPPAPSGAAVGDGTGSSSAGAGFVEVIGLGPAGRDWLTPHAQAALAAADDIVGYGTYVDRVPLNPRQRRHASDNRAEGTRAEFALELALRGRRVAVVSSGDPGVFAMASAVIEAAASDPRYADVPVSIVPGLTAAQAVASRAGAPLGHDYAVISLSDRLKPWSAVAARLEAAARADLAIAIYNPASRTRREQIAAARELLLGVRDPQTPVIVGRAVGSPQERLTITTLRELDPDIVDMQSLLIIGSSQTRAGEHAGQPIVYTPRRYPSEADASSAP